MFNRFQKQSLLHRNIQSFKKTILSGETLLKKESILVFTCGKKPSNENPGGRDLLLKYAEKFLSNFYFFIAENFFEALSKSDSGKDDIALSDLLKIEEKLTKYSDCIIIVLESSSAIAELGAFTIRSDLAEIVMVVNDTEFQDSESFISLGPLKRVDEKSKFRPVIYTKLESISRSFADITERLQKIKRGKNKRILFDTAQKFIGGYHDETDKKGDKFEKNRLLFIADIISLFSPLTFNELVSILKEIYGTGERYNFLHNEIKLLIALDLIDVDNEYYYRTTKDINLFFEYSGLNTRQFRSAVMNHYYKRNRKRFRILRNRVNVA
jgi:hypothetical protein